MKGFDEWQLPSLRSKNSTLWARSIQPIVLSTGPLSRSSTASRTMLVSGHVCSPNLKMKRKGKGGCRADVWFTLYD